MIKGMIYGKPSDREKGLTKFLGNALADYMEKHKTERKELMCALSFVCSIIFSKDTPFTNVEEQCDEIDSFCEFLKFKAKLK